MATRIKRGGKRIRGSDGKRTRNEDCCCVDCNTNCTTLYDWLDGMTAMEVDLSFVDSPIVLFPTCDCTLTSDIYLLAPIGSAIRSPPAFTWDRVFEYVEAGTVLFCTGGQSRYLRSVYFAIECTGTTGATLDLRIGVGISVTPTGAISYIEMWQESIGYLLSDFLCTGGSLPVGVLGSLCDPDTNTFDFIP